MEEQQSTFYKDALGKPIFIGDKVKYEHEYYEVCINPCTHKAVIDNDHGQTDLDPIARQCKVMPNIDDTGIYNIIVKLRNDFYGKYYGEPDKVFLGTDLIEILVDSKQKWEIHHYTADTWTSRLYGPTVMMVMNMKVIPVAEPEHISVGVSVKGSI